MECIMPSCFRNVLVTVTTLALAVAANAAAASGFQLREYSAAAGSHAAASIGAGALDAGHVAYNPAALGWIEGSRIAAGVTWVDVGLQSRDSVAPGGGPEGDGGTAALIPALAVKTELSPRWDVGVTVGTPWGLRTDYDRDWVGRYHAVESELRTVNLQPAVSFRARDGLIVGAGVQIQYADAALSEAIDFGRLAGSVPGQDDGFARISGDDVGYGFTFGMLMALSERTRLGVAFHSQIHHRLDGEADFDTGGPSGEFIAAATGAFRDTGAATDLTTPAVVTIGASHEFSPQWTGHASAQWTRWSSFEELRIEFDNPNQEDSVTEHRWNNSWMLSAGVDFRPNGRWVLRSGIGFEETPVPDATRGPRVPDSDRFWFGIGATHALTPRLDISGSWAHVFFDDARVDLEGEGTNAFRGDLRQRFENRADLISVQADYRF
jgi:long-chain fatty acid transport protein